jgi:hypothetical protein
MTADSRTGARAPLLLMDIDGVLNAFGGWGWFTGREEAPAAVDPSGLRAEVAGGYWLLLNDQHVAWLTELEQSFEIIWTTMWQQQAPTVFAPVLGVGTDWPWLDFAAHTERRAEARTGAGVAGYKFPAVREVVVGRPAVWVDDDLDSVHHAWAQKRSALGLPTLVVQPDPHVGLVESEVELVRGFARRLDTR